jgi:hypothetical protein
LENRNRETVAVQSKTRQGKVDVYVLLLSSEPQRPQQVHIATASSSSR